MCDNLRRFIRYVSTTNFVEMCTILLASFLGSRESRWTSCLFDSGSGRRSIESERVRLADGTVLPLRSLAAHARQAGP